MVVGAGLTIHAAQTADIRIDTASLVFAPVATTPIYVELDWMEDGTHSHQPSQAVIDSIVATFAREGYAININVSNAIPHQAVLATNGSPSGSAAVQALKASYFNNAADSRYFYSIWAHNYSINGGFTTSSGLGDLQGLIKQSVMSWDSPFIRPISHRTPSRSSTDVGHRGLTRDVATPASRSPPAYAVPAIVADSHGSLGRTPGLARSSPGLPRSDRSPGSSDPGDKKMRSMTQSRPRRRCIL